MNLIIIVTIYIQNDKFMPLLILATLTQPVWTNVFFYLFILSMLISFFITIIGMNLLKYKEKENITNQQQHSAKIDVIRKEQQEKLEAIRHEVSRHESERNKQWSESEREMLYVLSGVSNLLDISEKIGRIESDKILAKLDEINSKLIEKTINE